MIRLLVAALVGLCFVGCGSESDDAGAGQGGSGGDDSMAGVGGAAGGDPDTCVMGAVAPSQVVMIGDSYLALSGNVTKVLQQHARDAGVLGADENYRTNYVSGTQLAGGANSIPSQYDQAKATDPDIKLLIMTGGGNDVLIGNRSCLQTAPPENTSCLDTINAGQDAAQLLFDTAAADGVTDIIYFFYPHLPEGGILTGPAVNATTDYAYPIVKAGCEDYTGLNCHFIDTRAAFEGHADYIGPDGIHPTLGGSTAIADLIWERMVDECLAQ